MLPEPLEHHLKGWGRRLSGCALILVGLVTWAALVSWSSAELRAGGAEHARNLLGRPGAVAADLAMQLLGVTTLLLALFPLAWGGELAARQSVNRWKLRLLLAPIAIFALAGGLSALPSLPRWPLLYGHGGVVGDLAFQLVASILGTLNPQRAGVAAGLVLIAAGTAATVAVLGLTRAEVQALWSARDGRSHRTPRTGVRAEPDLDSVARSLDTPRPPDLAPPPRHEPQFMLAPELPLRPESSAVPAATPVDHEPELHLDDEPTVEGSRAIARRFAPQNGAAVASPEQPPLREEAEPAPRSRLMGMLRPPAIEPKGYRRPSLNDLVQQPQSRPGTEVAQAALRGHARLLEDVLADFSIKGEIKDIRPGPVVTVFELEPARGTKASRVIGLADDIARSMSVASVRVAVVPGRSVIGIELPNPRREMVPLREILESKSWREAAGALPLAIGKSIAGDPVVIDLARMPHLLVAGTTGSGKSVGVNTMILSLLYRHAPEDCRLLMIDPKMLELSVYNGIPHLLTPVVTDPHKAAAALGWVVREMEERYKRMADLAVRNLEMYNTRVRHALKRGEKITRTVQTGFDEQTGEAIFESRQLDLEPMPHIVVVVDEFADLMMVAGKDVETAVQRLAQMARAAGIHLVMATQRPSVDVITGTIKANFPSRISFKVASKIDSRTILNEQGAEQLLGQGDMLLSNGGGASMRVHGAFVSDAEVERIATHLREQGEPRYVDGITDLPDGNPDDDGGGPDGPSGGDLYDRAVAIVMRDQKASTSYLQRRLGIGYNRAADLMDRMEREGLVGPASGGGGKRAILGPGARPPMAAE